MSFPRRAGRASVRAFAVAAIATAVLTVGSQAAFADTPISINSGNVPTTAAGFNSHDCDKNFGGGPFADQDVWVFVLPTNHDTSGDFVSITANFTGHPDQTITAASDTGNFSNGGPATSKGWIITPAGWTLTGATAVITGTASFFNLTHTCPASGPSPSESPSTSPSGSPSESPSGSPSESPSGSPSSSVSGSVSSSPSSSPSSPSLPTTGSSLTGVLITGLLLVGAGAATVIVARRRRPAA